MVRTFGSISTLILVLALNGYSQTARLTKLASPQPVTIAGYIRGHCVPVDLQTRVCKMLSEDKDTFLLEREGKPVGTWPGNSYLGETSDFEALRGDLDGDGRPELIVANHDSTSAGMGGKQWTIFIFPDTEFRNFAPPLSFGVEEYGAFGTFVATNRGVNILTTRWMWRKGEGKRGIGLYLVGQWWRYKAGELDSIPTRPILARRYLASFERERLRTIDDVRVPYHWLLNPSVRALGTHPLLETRNKTLHPGIIDEVTVRNTDSARNVKIMFKPGGEQPMTCVYVDDEADAGEFGFRYFGDAATGRIYPIRYLPSSPERWLKGQRATLITYGDDSDNREFRVLWRGAHR